MGTLRRIAPLARLACLAVCLLACLLALRPAVAHAAGPPASRPGGRIALSFGGGGAGPLVLQPGQGGWTGTMTVTNVGAETLIVSRVAIRGDEDDVRSPARLGVRFVDGPATSATLAPGAAKDLVVSWMPDKDPRVKQAFGHVVVTSTDEESGEVAMGFRAQVPTELGWLGEHALSTLVLLPLLVLVVAGASRLAGRRDDPFVGHFSIALAATELLLALWVFTRFATDVGRADGNDGFQLVERSVWVRSIGAEWYLGLDGVSIALVPLAAVLWLVALVIVRERRRTDAYFSATALLAASVCGVLVALDLVVLFAAWQLVLVALVMLVGGWGGRRADHAAAKLAGYGALGSGAMLCAFVALSRASGRTFLVDGTAVLHTLSIPELARTSFAARAPILGLPLHEVTWALLFVAVAVTTPVVPLHGWLPELLEEAPAGAAIFVTGIVTGLGPYLLVRVGLGAMPEGARWAGASIAALGVLSMGYGGLCAMAQRDLRRFVAYASIASAGGTLFGVGGLHVAGPGGGHGGHVRSRARVGAPARRGVRARAAPSHHVADAPRGTAERGAAARRGPGDRARDLAGRAVPRGVLGAGAVLAGRVRAAPGARAALRRLHRRGGHRTPARGAPDAARDLRRRVAHERRARGPPRLDAGFFVARARRSRRGGGAGGCGRGVADAHPVGHGIRGARRSRDRRAARRDSLKVARSLPFPLLRDSRPAGVADGQAHGETCVRWQRERRSGRERAPRVARLRLRAEAHRRWQDRALG